MRYVDGKPHSIDTVVLSTQHTQWSLGDKMKPEFSEAIIEEIIKAVLPKEWLPKTPATPDQPHRSLRDRWPQGDCGSDRPQDHRRHLRRRFALTAVVPSGKDPPGRPLGCLMPLVMWPRTSWPPVWPSSARCKWPMPLAWPSP